MTDEQWLEQVSVAYVQAVTVACGPNFKLEYDSIDDRCVDVKVITPDPLIEGGFANVQILLQLKCTAVPDIRDGLLHFRVKQRLFEYMTRPSVDPHYLVVLVVPEQPQGAAIEWTDEKVSICRCAYWYAFPRDFQWPGDQDSTTVRIPVSQVLQPASLYDLLRVQSEYIATLMGGGK